MKYLTGPALGSCFRVPKICFGKPVFRGRLLERKPDYSAAFARQELFFCNDDAFVERFIAGLRIAGIPAG